MNCQPAIDQFQQPPIILAGFMPVGLLQPFSRFALMPTRTSIKATGSIHPGFFMFFLCHYSLIFSVVKTYYKGSGVNPNCFGLFETFGMGSNTELLTNFSKEADQCWKESNAKMQLFFDCSLL